MSELLGYAAGEGDVVLQSRAAADEGLPYATVVSALRPLLGRGTMEDISTTTLSALAPLFPEVRRLHADLPKLPDVSAQQEQERLLGAVERLVETCLPDGGLLHVDDAHRADAASCDLLTRLADHVTVVLTCRSEETGPDHPLRIALHALRREGRVGQLTLDPLSPGAVEALIRQLGRNDLPELVEAVVVDTGGNAVFLLALLQHMFEEGALYVEANGRWAATSGAAVSLPPTVRETIEARLQRLSREARRVFDLAAVAGGEFDFDLLQHASGMEETPLLDVLDGLLETGPTF